MKDFVPLTLRDMWEAATEYFNRPGARRARAKVPFDGAPILLCAYRTPSGRRCAIGVSIPDSLYDESMEGKRAFDVLTGMPGLVSNVDLASVNMLQDCHDRASNIAEVRENLKKFGENWGF